MQNHTQPIEPNIFPWADLTPDDSPDNVYAAADGTPIKGGGLFSIDFATTNGNEHEIEFRDAPVAFPIQRASPSSISPPVYQPLPLQQLANGSRTKFLASPNQSIHTPLNDGAQAHWMHWHDQRMRPGLDHCP